MEYLRVYHVAHVHLTLNSRARHKNIVKKETKRCKRRLKRDFSRLGKIVLQNCETIPSL